MRFSVIGSVFNILNTEIATSRNGILGTGGITDPGNLNPRFDFNNAYQRPRRYEAGVRLSF